MWKKISLVFNAFLVGMLFEYTLRVEVAFLPIFLGSVLLLSICLDIFWLDRIKATKNTLVKEINIKTKEIIATDKKLKEEIPKGWMVHEAGQDPLHMLWYAHLVNFDDLAESTNPIREVVSIEFDSYEEAIKDAISQINLASVENV